MPGTTSEQLIAGRRLAEALEVLEQQKQSNRRVYGLDQSLEQVRQTMAQADRGVADARAYADRGKVRHAVHRLKEVRQSVVDHPEVCQLLPIYQQQINQAKQLRQQAARLLDEEQWQKAWETAQHALEQDGESKTAQHQIDQARDAMDQEISDKRARRLLTVSAVTGGVVLVLALIGVFIFNTWSRDHRQARQHTLDQAEQTYRVALTQIDDERYDKAEGNLSAASQTLQDHDLSEDSLYEAIQQTRSSKAMKQGLAGRVPLGDKWVTPKKRETIRKTRQSLSKSIDALINLIQQGIQGKMPGMSGKPPAAQLSALRQSQGLAQQAHGAFAAGDYDKAKQQYDQASTAVHNNFESAGLVQYKTQWMLPKQAKAHRMRDKGLVRYGERWVTPEKKFALQQKAKGLVRFENAWKTPGEVQRIKAKRRKAAEQARQKRQAQAKAARKKRMKRLARDAYRMSKRFVKDALKAPASAEFPSYSDDDVVVGEAKTKGHFLVIAYVDAQNGFGAMLRKKYIVELWPTDDEAEHWKAEPPVLVDD